MISKTTKWIIAGTIAATVAGGLLGYCSAKPKHKITKSSYSNSNHSNNTSSNNPSTYDLRDVILDAREAALDAREAALETKKLASELEKKLENQKQKSHIDYQALKSRDINRTLKKKFHDPCIYGNDVILYNRYDYSRNMAIFHINGVLAYRSLDWCNSINMINMQFMSAGAYRSRYGGGFFGQYMPRNHVRPIIRN